MVQKSAELLLGPCHFRLAGDLPRLPPHFGAPSLYHLRPGSPPADIAAESKRFIGAQRPSTPEPMGAAQNPITVESSPESVDLREPVAANCRPGRGIDLLAEVHRVSMELEEEDRESTASHQESRTNQQE